MEWRRVLAMAAACCVVGPALAADSASTVDEIVRGEQDGYAQHPGKEFIVENYDKWDRIAEEYAPKTIRHSNGTGQSCHDATADGNGMQQWNNVKHEALQSINKVENAQGNFASAQDKASTQDELRSSSSFTVITTIYVTHASLTGLTSTCSRACSTSGVRDQRERERALHEEAARAGGRS